ncbi:MAG: hypothetical protein WCT22_00115 [Patescibacteria group bacterium]
MLNSLLEILRPPGLEMKDIIQSISLTNFVTKTAPMTIGTELPQLAQKMVNRISIFCKPDENDNFAIVRGGSMRSYLFENYVVDEHFSKIFSDVDKSLLGDDPLAGQVINKVFSLPKDIDVFFRSKYPNKFAHQDNMLFHNVIEELEDAGYKQIKQNEEGNVLIFDNGQYQVKVLRHQTGIKHSQTLVKIDFSEKGQDIMKLHFGLIPNEEESEEDPRFFKETADIERDAIGFLSNNNGKEISLRYFGLGGMSYVELYMMEHFFDPILNKFTINKNLNPDQVISSHLREINFRVALISSLFNIGGIEGIGADLQNTPYSKLVEKYEFIFNSQTSKLKLDQMLEWFRSNQHNIKDHFKLTASDIVYGLSVNPFLFFLFASSTQILEAFPLGSKLISISLIKKLLEKIANKIGCSLEVDSLLTLSLKYNIFTKEAKDTAIFQLMEFLEEPETISAFLKLIDPLAKVSLEE